MERKTDTKVVLLRLVRSVFAIVVGVLLVSMFSGCANYMAKNFGGT